jgi:hypothetical protein
LAATPSLESFHYPWRALAFFSEYRCQTKALAYTPIPMAGIMGLDVKKIGHFIPPRLAQSNGSQKLP